ncbi:MAG: COX15/CtaA family protein [Acidobacteriaceae bacterium]|nr:COX15/CtaA family protein [Acidobacteriaceae bacterium]
MNTGRKWFARFAWFALAFNLPVILWGAYVRISFSGDGCGAHWPFCNGQMLPRQMAAPMAIEFVHRMMTSVDTLIVIALCIWAFRAFPRRHGVRLYATLSLIFLFIEALLGAGLVLFRYVAHDQSAGRAIYLSAHLTNTMLLLGALTVTALLATRNREHASFGSMPGSFAVALAVTVFVSITGAVTALGDTLFPASSIAAGISQDWSSESSMLLRLRVVHPAIAVAGAIYLIFLSWRVLRCTGTEETKAAGRRVFSLTILQVAAGAVNLGLLAPLSMQMIHLLIADVLWIAVVLMVTEITASESIRHGAEAAAGGGDMELAIGLERRPTERGSSARHSSAS